MAYIPNIWPDIDYFILEPLARMMESPQQLAALVILIALVVAIFTLPRGE